MRRAELQRRLHELRVEAYALALFDERPRGPLSRELLDACQQRCRQIAERKVTEYERTGVFTTGIERVA